MKSTSFPWIQILSTLVALGLITFSIWWIQYQKELFSQQVPPTELFPKYDETNKSVNTYNYAPIHHPKLKGLIPSTEIYKTAIIFAEWETPLPDGSGILKTQMVKSGHKYPLLMVRGVFSLNGKLIKPIEEWVADHVLVTLKKGYNSNDLQTLVREQGAEIRSWSRLGDFYFVAFNPSHENAIFTLMEKLKSSPMIQTVNRDFLNRKTVKSPDHP